MSRVLVVTPWEGGFVGVQTRLLAEAGHSVQVLTLGITDGPRAWVALCAVLVGLFIRIQQRPDVVHAYSAWPAGIVGSLLAWRLNRPLIVHEHLSPPERLQRLPFVLKVLDNATRILSPSREHAHRLSRLCGMRHVTVVPNPVVVPFLPLRTRRKRPLVVCMGRMVEQKGFDRVAEATHLLPDYDFCFIGDGPEAKRISLLAGPNAHFLPSVLPHGQAMWWLHCADVVCCPSRHESFGLVAAEAAALGTPVVATDVGVHSQVAAYRLPQHAAPETWAGFIRMAVAKPRLFSVRIPGTSPEEFTATMSRLYDFPEDDI